MTTYRDVHNDEYYLPEDPPACTEDGMTKAERLRDERIDNEILEQLEDEK